MLQHKQACSCCPHLLLQSLLWLTHDLDMNPALWVQSGLVVKVGKEGRQPRACKPQTVNKTASRLAA